MTDFWDESGYQPEKSYAGPTPVAPRGAGAALDRALARGRPVYEPVLRPVRRAPAARRAGGLRSDLQETVWREVPRTLPPVDGAPVGPVNADFGVRAMPGYSTSIPLLGRPAPAFAGPAAVADQAAAVGFPERINFSAFGQSPGQQLIEGVADSPFGAFAGLTTGEQKGGSITGPFGIPIATAPITIANAATWGREGMLALLSSAVSGTGRYEQEPGAMFGEQVAGPDDASKTLIDNVIDGANMVGDAVWGVFDGAMKWYRDINSSNRGAELRQIAQTGAIQLTTGNITSFLTAQLLGGDRTTAEKIAAAAIAKGETWTAMAAKLYDLDPRIVQTIMANPNIGDEELKFLTSGQPLSTDAGVNILLELGIQAGMLVAGGVAVKALQGAALAPRLLGAGAAARGGAYAVKGIDVLWKINSGITLSGWGVRGGELAAKEFALLMGNQAWVDHLDKLLWEMPLSTNPGLNLIDGFGTHVLKRTNPLTGERRWVVGEVLKGDIYAGQGKNAVGVSLRNKALIMGERPVEALRVAGIDADIPVNLRTGTALARIDKVSLDDIITRVTNKIGWEPEAVRAIFGDRALPDGTMPIASETDLKNALLYQALSEVRDRAGDSARALNPAIGLSAFSAEWVTAHIADAAKLLENAVVKGDTGWLVKRFREMYWQHGTPDASELGMEPMYGDFDALTSFAQFRGWTWQSKFAADTIAKAKAEGRQIASEDWTLALAERIDAPRVKAAIATMDKRGLKPEDRVPAQVLNLIRLAMPSLVMHPELRPGPRKGWVPAMTRRRLEEIMGAQLKTENAVRATESRFPTGERPPITADQVEAGMIPEMSKAAGMPEDMVKDLMPFLDDTAPEGSVIPETIVKWYAADRNIPLSVAMSGKGGALLHAMSVFEERLADAQMRGGIIVGLEEFANRIKGRPGAAPILEAITSATQSLHRPPRDDFLARQPAAKEFWRETLVEALDYFEKELDALLDDPVVGLQTVVHAERPTLLPPGANLATLMESGMLVTRIRTAAADLTGADLAILSDPVQPVWEKLALLSERGAAMDPPLTVDERALLERMGKPGTELFHDDLVRVAGEDREFTAADVLDLEAKALAMNETLAEAAARVEGYANRLSMKPGTGVADDAGDLIRRARVLGEDEQFYGPRKPRTLAEEYSKSVVRVPRWRRAVVEGPWFKFKVASPAPRLAQASRAAKDLLTNHSAQLRKLDIEEARLRAGLGPEHVDWDSIPARKGLTQNKAKLAQQELDTASPGIASFIDKDPETGKWQVWQERISWYGVERGITAPKGEGKAVADAAVAAYRLAHPEEKIVRAYHSYSIKGIEHWEIQTGRPYTPAGRAGAAAPPPPPPEAAAPPTGQSGAPETAGVAPDAIPGAPAAPDRALAPEAAIQAAYDAGNIAEGQRLNVEEGIARGGTAESGGAVKPDGLKALIADAKAKNDRLDALAAAGERPIEVPRRDGQGSILVGPDVRRPGMWMSGYIDPDGTPTGHVEADSYREALENVRGFADVEAIEAAHAAEAPAIVDLPDGRVAEVVSETPEGTTVRPVEGGELVEVTRADMADNTKPVPVEARRFSVHQPGVDRSGTPRSTPYLREDLRPWEPGDTGSWRWLKVPDPDKVIKYQTSQLAKAIKKGDEAAAREAKATIREYEVIKARWAAGDLDYHPELDPHPRPKEIEPDRPDELEAFGDVAEPMTKAVSDARSLAITNPELLPRSTPAAAPVGRGKETGFPDPYDETKTIPATFRVVELDELVSSDQPGYRTELQPRDRAGRLASDEQIVEMTQSMTTEPAESAALMLRSESGAEGTPVIAPDGHIIAANGRVMAMREAGAPMGTAMKEAITARADEFGVDPAVVAGMKYPVLVREVPAELASSQLAGALNVATGGMSITEQAAAIATRITADDVGAIDFGRSKDLAAALDTEDGIRFAKKILGKLTQRQQAQYLTPKGGLNRQGVDLVQAALMSKLMRDPASNRIVTEFFETADTDVGRIRNGLLGALKPLLEAHALIETGNRFANLAIGDSLAPAIDQLITLRGQALTASEIRDVLSSPTMFESADDVFARELALVLHTARSQTEITEFFTAYAKAVKDSEDPSSATMFYTPAALPKWQIANNAIAAINDARLAADAKKGGMGLGEVEVIRPFSNAEGDVPLSEDRMGPTGITQPPVLESPVHVDPEAAAADAARRVEGARNVIDRSVGAPGRTLDDGVVDDLADLEGLTRADAVVVSVEPKKAVAPPLYEEVTGIPHAEAVADDVALAAALDSSPAHIVVSDARAPLTVALKEHAGALPTPPDPKGPHNLEFHRPDEAARIERLEQKRIEIIGRMTEAQRVIDEAETPGALTEETSVPWDDPEMAALWTRFAQAPDNNEVVMRLTFGEDFNGPKDLGEVMAAVDSIDKNLYGDLTPAEAQQLRGALMDVGERTLQKAGGEASPAAQARRDRLMELVAKGRARGETGPVVVDDPAILPAALDDLASRLAGKIEAFGGDPIEGFTGYQLGILPRRSKFDRSPLTPRIQYRDLMGEFKDLIDQANATVPGLGDDLLEGPIRTLPRRISDARFSRSVVQMVDLAFGARHEKALAAAAKDRFLTEIAAIVGPNVDIASLDRDLKAIITGIHGYMQIGWGMGPFKVPIHRRLATVSPAEWRHQAEMALKAIHNNELPPWWAMVDQQPGGIERVWLLADNRFREWLRQSKPGLLTDMDRLWYRSSVGRHAGELKRDLNVLYNFGRFILDARWHALEFIETDALLIGRDGIPTWRRFSKMQGGARNLRRPPGPAEMPPMWGEVDRAAARQGWAWWASQMEEIGVYGRARDNAILAAMKKESPQELERTLLRWAQQDPILSSTLKTFGETPGQWLDRLVRDWQAFDAITDPRAWSRLKSGGRTKLLSQFDELKGDKATAAAAKDAYPGIPEIERAIGESRNDPRVVALYERLREINNSMYDDLAALFYGQPDRSNFQRLLNHPLLYWPISYQLKATKWLASILFDSAFGVDTGAGGAVVLSNVHDRHIERYNSDPAYRKWFADHKTLLFIGQMLLPITPFDIGVSLAPWTRIALNMANGDDYSRNVFSVGPGYTYFSLLPRLFFEENKAGGVFNAEGPLGGVGDVGETTLPLTIPIKPASKSALDQANAEAIRGSLIEAGQPIPNEYPTRGN